MQNKKINLALQGGGAHGAYTWGALDALLDNGHIDIEGITATSAGSMNACALAYGMHIDGRQGAKDTLHNLWHNVYEKGVLYSSTKRLPIDHILFPNSDYSLSYIAFDMLSHIVSPYQTNPIDINPLRDIVSEVIDFDALQQCKNIQLFIGTTHIATGQSHIFKNEDITRDVVMASAALPNIFKAVEIDGEHYWDGGYSGNPPLYPLFHNTESRDIMIFHINPLHRKEIPDTATEIANRTNEISFNSCLLKEIRSIEFVKKLLRNDMLKDSYKEQFKDILLHSIRADESLCDLSVASKYETEWSFLTMLHDRGYEAMQTWLAKHFDAIGIRDTVDMYKDFLQEETA